ncbi:MAG: hypothetical protein M3R16_08905, partial [Pseudomonadota bacterium]|nr:hypothetical protein [Pseudomonadota bacterium]
MAPLVFQFARMTFDVGTTPAFGVLPIDGMLTLLVDQPSLLFLRQALAQCIVTMTGRGVGMALLVPSIIVTITATPLDKIALPV